MGKTDIEIIINRVATHLALAFCVLATPGPRAAGPLSPPGTGNNDGSSGPVWRWNETMGNKVTLDGLSSLEVLVNSEFNQYIDTTIPEPLSGKSLAFVAIFSKSGGGNSVMGFARDQTWGQGAAPTKQRFFKIIGVDLFIAQEFIPTNTDEDTGVDIVPDTPQGLMIKVAPDGGVTYFYQNGADKNIQSEAWQDITPASSPVGNLSGFDPLVSMIGVNSLTGGMGTIRVDKIGLYDLTDGVSAIVEDEFEDRAGDPRPLPKLNNLFPFGGRQGTVQDVLIKGENLQGAYAIWFGKGSKVFSLDPAESTPAGAKITQAGDGLQAEIKGDPAATQINVRLVIPPDAPAGDHALRAVTPNGLSSAVSFRVSPNPVIREADGERNTLATAQPIPVPSAVNGQITAVGQLDHYVFEVDEPRTLRFEVAKMNGSGFDPVLALYETKGSLLDPDRNKRLMFNEEIAYGTFPPNRVVTYDFSEPGRYLINIGSIFTRSGADFWYMLRISRTEPLGPLAGGLAAAQAKLQGLQARAFRPTNFKVVSAAEAAAAQPGASPAASPPGPGQTAVIEETAPVPPAQTLNGAQETEPNDEPGTHTLAFTVPALVEGVIGEGGDIDHFRFTASAGQQLVFEIETPRAAPPLFNPRIDVTDAEGKEIITNLQFSGATITSVAGRVVAKFETAGEYHLAVRDVTSVHGGSEYYYRVLVRPELPHLGHVHVAGEDRLNLIRGVPQQVTINTPRQEGYNGDFAVTVEDLPPGVKSMFGTAGLTMVLVAEPNGPVTMMPQIIRFSGRPVLNGQFGPQFPVQELPVMVLP